MLNHIFSSEYDQEEGIPCAYLHHGELRRSRTTPQITTCEIRCRLVIFLRDCESEYRLAVALVILYRVQQERKKFGSFMREKRVFVTIF